MLMERIIGAFTFKKEVYAEVEDDTSFTQTAWMIVVVVAVISQLGQVGNYGGLMAGLIGTVISILFAVGGFALAAFVISFVGKAMFNAQTDFDEMVRVLGLAYVWNGIGVVGILGAILPLLLCVLAPALFIGWIMGIISWYIAVQEALDLEMGETLITLVIGAVATFIVTAIGSGIIGILGFGTAALLGAG